MRALNTYEARLPRDDCPSRRPGLRSRARGAQFDRMPRRRDLGAMPRRVEVDLTADAVEQIANRVVSLLREEPPLPGPRPLTAGELAYYLGVDRAWIYRHRHMLGGERIGDGPKAPWRFDLETAKAALARHRAARIGESGQ
jgi:hypothetical protein